jgi:hypothetical protein
MDIRVKPSALTCYMLLSQREAVMVSNSVPILLPAPPVFNPLVSDTSVLYINPAASSRNLSGL